MESDVEEDLADTAVVGNEGSGDRSHESGCVFVTQLEMPSFTIPNTPITPPMLFQTRIRTQQRERKRQSARQGLGIVR